MPKKLDRCVRKAKKKVKNPYAVCTASLKRKKRASNNRKKMG